MSVSMRQLVKIIQEICLEHNIEFKSFSYDWILELAKDNNKLFVYGYKFSNNDAAIEQICNDKSALSDILLYHKIPHVRHHFFTVPKNKNYMGQNGDWERISQLLQEYNKIVCKTNSGSGGKLVYKVDNQSDLEIAVHKVFSKSRSMSIAPFIDIKSEYRVIIINSDIGVIYEKKRPFVIGDGISNLKQLVAKDNSLVDIEIDNTIDTNYIPKSQEVIEISWKHNLGQGARPVIITDQNLIEQLSELAYLCANTLNLKFASIDIIEDDNGLEILEINSGVMMENLATSSDENYIIAKKIYEKAILNYLNIHK